MSTADKSWARWIKASIRVHMRPLLEAGHPMFIEGQHRDTDALPNFFELRVDGPRLRNVSKDCWKIRVEINILCQSVMNDTDSDIIDDMVGLAQSALTNLIEVFRYGNRPTDDDSFLGCLKRQDSKRDVDFLEANRLGQIDIQTKLLQSMVEAHYVMDLQT